MKTLLIVDDDSALNDLLAAYFKDEYAIAQAFDGEDALDKFIRVKPDVILLDVMMPKKSGIDVLKMIRKTSKTPVLMLTAKAEEIDKIIGLELGADDYVAKPCNPRELAARIKNLLNRTQVSPVNENMLITRDEVRRQIRINDEALSLTSIEYDILSILYESMLSVINKNELFKHVFQREMQPFDRTLDVHISNIRKKLANTPIVIQTLRGKGYRLCPAEEN